MKDITEFNQLDLTGTYSYADYLTWKFRERVELLWGKVFKMTPGTDHQAISAIIQGNMFEFLKGKSCRVFSAPFDVRLPGSLANEEEKIFNVVQPDISVICDLKKLDKKGCNGAPDLVVEIISPGTVKKDLHEKYFLYEKNKVKEYWVVYPADKILSVFLLNNSGLFESMRPLTIGDRVKSTALPGFEMDLDEVFQHEVKEPEEDYHRKEVRIDP